MKEKTNNKKLLLIAGAFVITGVALFVVYESVTNSTDKRLLDSIVNTVKKPTSEEVFKEEVVMKTESTKDIEAKAAVDTTIQIQKETSNSTSSAMPTVVIKEKEEISVEQNKEKTPQSEANICDKYKDYPYDKMGEFVIGKGQDDSVYYLSRVYKTKDEIKQEIKNIRSMIKKGTQEESEIKNIKTPRKIIKSVQIKGEDQCGYVGSIKVRYDVSAKDFWLYFIGSFPEIVDDNLNNK